MSTNKKNIVIRASVFVALGVLFFACSTSTKDEPKTDTVVDTTASVLTQKANYSLPSPLQIASIFKKAGMKYKDGVTSPMKDPKKYVTNLSKSLNLGVYSADLSYALLNKQNQVAMEYLKLSRDMAYNLGLGTVYEAVNIPKRFEKNINDMDSLSAIISDLQMETDMYLNENNQQQIAAIAFAGDWIESLFIASKVFKKEDEQVLNKKFSQQMSILESIINALTFEEKKDPAITGLIADLKKIKDVYDNLPVVKKHAEDTDGNQKILLTNADVALLIEIIEELRTKFING